MRNRRRCAGESQSRHTTEHSLRARLSSRCKKSRKMSSISIGNRDGKIGGDKAGVMASTTGLLSSTPASGLSVLVAAFGEVVLESVSRGASDASIHDRDRDATNLTQRVVLH